MMPRRTLIKLTALLPLIGPTVAKAFAKFAYQPGKPMNCKATFELSKGRETTTETRNFQFFTKEELFAQIRSYVEAAARKGFNVNTISTVREREGRGERKWGES